MKFVSTAWGKIKGLFRFLRGSDGSLKGKTIRSGAWLGISGIFNQGLSFVRSVILARLLTPEIFGLMAIALIVVRFIEAFTRSGLEAALIQRQADFKEACDTAFSLLVLRGVILSTVVIVSSPWIADFYNEDQLVAVLVAMAFSLVFVGFNNINLIARQKELDFQKQAFVDITTQILSTIATVVIAYFTRSVWALVAGYLLTAFFYALLSYVFLPGKPRFAFNTEIAKELLSYGKFITGTSIILYIAGELDNLVIGKVLSMADLGYYVLAFTLANMVTTFLSRMLSGALFPAYSKIQSDIEAVNRVFSKSLILLLYFIVPAAVGLAILAPELVHLIYGPKWNASVDPMIALCVFGVLRGVMSLIGYLLQAIGKPNLDLYSGTFRLLLLGTLIYPAAIYYGIEGVAWVVAFSMSMQMSIGFWFLKRHIEFRVSSVLVPVAGVFLRNAFMAVAVIGVSHYLDASNNLWGLIAAVATGVVSYLAISYKPILALFKRSA